MKIKFISLILFFSLLIPCFSSCEKSKSFTFFALDTEIEIISLWDANESDIDFIKSEVKRYEKIFSRTMQGAEVYEINESADMEFDVSNELYELLNLSLKIAQITDGAFDFTLGTLTDLWDINNPNSKIPSDAEINSSLSYTSYKNVSLTNCKLVFQKKVKLDFGAIAKGYIADKIVSSLKERGVTHGIISFGGNIAVFGAKPSGESFKVGIKKDKDTVSGFVKLKDGFISVSAAYERQKTVDGISYHHIFDSKTGYPAQSDLISACVVSENGAICDAMTTALFVMGEDKAKDFIKEQNSISAIIFNKDGSYSKIGNITYTES